MRVLACARLSYTEPTDGLQEANDFDFAYSIEANFNLLSLYLRLAHMLI